MLSFSMKSYWVYILASRPRGTLYVGMTNDLVRRVYQHREGLADGFSQQYGVKMLVYYEQHATALAAIQREKNIKHWSRAWKLDLIRTLNPDWRDLWEDVAQQMSCADCVHLSAMRGPWLVRLSALRLPSWCA
jgi:putative endonuclease